MMTPMCKTHLFIPLLFALLTAGCDSPPPKDTLAPPVLDPGKADGPIDTIDPRGDIALGGEGRGSFVRDGQLEGWHFEAEAGSVIRAEITVEGSSAALDSTLFLYGPQATDGTWSDPPLASDDDSGFELHALLDTVTLPEAGTYRLVVGTFLNLDRGDYRLALTCLNAACLPLPANDNAGITLSRNTLTVGEARGQDSLQLQLSSPPTEHVLLRLSSSDPDEGVVYPQNIYFCTPGHVVGGTGCVPTASVEGAVEPNPPHWSRAVDVTVFGVADGVSDGDTDLEITLQVVSDAPDYRALSPAPIPVTNLDDPTAPAPLTGLEGLADDALLAALHQVLAHHEVYGYHGHNSARTLMFATVDAHDGHIEGLYGGTTTPRPFDSISGFQAGYNTEHTWPQGQFDKLEPMVSDLHHIFPVEIDLNGERSSFPFGLTASQPNATHSRLGTDTNGDTVYQVRPERRGDVARAHFYMVARYKHDASLGIRFDDDARPENGCIQDTEEAVLRSWHRDDPVDDLERSRNARIEAYQGQRNPFIDHPELVDQIADF